MHERITFKLKFRWFVYKLLRDGEFASNFHLFYRVHVDKIRTRHSSFHICSDFKSIFEFQLAFGKGACSFKRSSLLRLYFLRHGFLFLSFCLNSTSLLIFFVLSNDVHPDLILDWTKVTEVEFFFSVRNNFIRFNTDDRSLFFLLLARSCKWSRGKVFR